VHTQPMERAPQVQISRMQEFEAAQTRPRKPKTVSSLMGFAKDLPELSSTGEAAGMPAKKGRT
jgi:hypothetical protein